MSTFLDVYIQIEIQKFLSRVFSFSFRFVTDWGPCVAETLSRGPYFFLQV